MSTNYGKPVFKTPVLLTMSQKEKLFGINNNHKIK